MLCFPVDSQHSAQKLWLAMNDPYHEILVELARAQVEFVLGGGLACVMQGVERVTMDVDLAVLMEENNFTSFTAVMKNLRLRPRLPIPPEQLLNASVVEMMVKDKQALVYTFFDVDRPIRQVDVLIDPELTYEKLVPESDWMDIKGEKIRVLTKKKLLQLKLGIHPVRAKDLMDIEFLRRHLDAE